jgi:hypothetical protein
MRNGTVYQRRPWVPRSAVSACSLLPTLVAADAKGARNGTAKGRRPSDGLTMTDWWWLNVARGMLPVWFAEWVMGFPQCWTALGESGRSATPSTRPLRNSWPAA